MENELVSIKEEISQQSTESEEHNDLVNYAQELSQRIQKLKEKSLTIKESKKNKKIEFAKHSQTPKEAVSGGIRFEVNISNLGKQKRLLDLIKTVKDLENSVGTWNESLPIAESLSNLLIKTFFLNENTLENIKDLARHLGNDLDSMLSNNTQSLASLEIIQIIEKLYDETYKSVVSSKSLTEIIQKLKVYQSDYLEHLETDKSLKKVNTSALILENRISESLDSVKDIKEGISNNKVFISQNIEILNKKK